MVPWHQSASLWLPLCTHTLSPPPYYLTTGFPGGTSGKESPCQGRRQETRVQSLGREDPLEKEMATHSSILAWTIPWTEEAGGLPSMGSWRVRHNWPCRYKWNHTLYTFEIGFCSGSRITLRLNQFVSHISISLLFISKKYRIVWVHHSLFNNSHWRTFEPFPVWG